MLTPELEKSQIHTGISKLDNNNEQFLTVNLTVLNIELPGIPMHIVHKRAEHELNRQLSHVSFEVGLEASKGLTNITVLAHP